ncbi:neprilysin-1-like isoform X3 [Dermacentor albipictus]|uniref:neprilysin-1-like isoform X3 n=1 Tax=Dermacentor albipictus TaxID=60249 RepID=UPI0038FD2D4A
MRQANMDFRLTEPHLSPHQQTLLARLGLVLLTAIVVLATLTLVLTRSRRTVSLPPTLLSPGGRRLRAPAQLCNATTCRLAAKLLKETTGYGDPCDDFYAYVCSGWLQRPSFVSTDHSQVALLSAHASSLLRSMAKNPVGLGAPARPEVSPLRGGIVSGTAALSSSVMKAAVLYDECLEASMDYRADALAAFLKDVGLGFAERVDHPVTRALELDLYYNVKALFNLRRHPTWTRPDGRPVVSLSARQDLQQWRHDRDHMIRHQTYAAFIRRYVVVMLIHENVTDASAKGFRSVDNIVQRVVSAEETVLALSSAMPEEDPDRYYAIVDLSPQNGSFLSTTASPEADVIRETAVGHPAMLAYKDFLETRMAAPELSGYVTWEVVRQLGPLADQKLSHGTVEGQCFDAVYHLMPYPSVLPYLEQLDSSKGWEEADLVYRDVTETLIRFMRRRGFELPHSNVSFSLDLPKGGQLDAFYGELPLLESSLKQQPFLETYLATLSGIRSKEIFSITHGDTVFSYPMPPPQSGKAQVSRNGRSRVPLTWLLPPLFGADMPPALNDGGLGINLAAALAKSSHLDRSWLGCLANLEPRADLRGQDFALARLTLVAEVVEEFVDLHSELARPLVLPALESVSEDKLFFIGACVGLCAKGDPQAPYRCNVPARNLPHFAATFECPAGSYMNPQQRCPYPNKTPREH